MDKLEHLKGNNPLLTSIVRFLDSNDLQLIERIASLLDEATTDQLVPSFAFLTFWMSSNNLSPKDSRSASLHQAAFHFISTIIQKVPPVILVSGVKNLNWSIDHPSTLPGMNFHSMLQRMAIIRDYFIRFFVEDKIYGYPPLFDERSKSIRLFQGRFIELESSPFYYASVKQQMKHLLLNNAAIIEFEPLLENRNAKLLLTGTIIDLMGQYNLDRASTQSQLIYNFSILFIYIQAFISARSIDGQMICEYIQSRPFISPFCMLGIINHIPTNIFLFSLLVPKLMSECKTKEEVVKIIQDQYHLVDLSIDNEYDYIVELMPEFMYIYFIADHNDKSIPPCLSEKEIMIGFHDQSYTLFERMKRMINTVKNISISTTVTAGTSTQVLNAVIVSFQRTFIDCIKKNFFSPPLRDFIRNTINLTLPSHGNAFVSRFFDSNNPNPNLFFSEMMMRAILINAVHLLVKTNTRQILLHYLISIANKKGDVETIAQLIITKMLLIGDIVFTNRDIINPLKQSKDVIVLIEFIDAIERFRNINFARDRNRLIELKNELISRLPFVITNKSPLTIGSIIESKLDDFTESNKTEIQSFTLNTSPHLHSCFGIRLAMLTSSISSYEYAEKLTYRMIEFITSQKEAGTVCSQFPLYLNDVALPIAQKLFVILLQNNYHLFAQNLFSAMIPLVQKSSTPLHWLVKMLPVNHKYLNGDLTRMIRSMIYQLPNVDTFLFEDIGMSIRLLTKYFDDIHRDPKHINHEYQSSYYYVLAFSTCQILTSSLTNKEVVDQLYKPVYERNIIWNDRDMNCKVAAHLASCLSPEIAIKFFHHIIKLKKSPLYTDIGRIFLVYAPIDVFTQIALDSQKLIKGDTYRLIEYVRAIMPTYLRLSGDEATATTMLSGILESINDYSPVWLQEQVIDITGLLYESLRLQKSRATFIKSSRHFKPNLRQIIASSLSIAVIPNGREERR